MFHFVIRSLPGCFEILLEVRCLNLFQMRYLSIISFSSSTWCDQIFSEMSFMVYETGFLNPWLTYLQYLCLSLCIRYHILLGHYSCLQAQLGLHWLWLLAHLHVIEERLLVPYCLAKGSVSYLRSVLSYIVSIHTIWTKTSLLNLYSIRPVSLCIFYISSILMSVLEHILKSHC